MQFYLDGYKPGDPDILTAELPHAVDVLIVGSGPAGALLAAQLSTFPSISTRLIERRDGPLPSSTTMPPGVDFQAASIASQSPGRISPQAVRRERDRRLQSYVAVVLLMTVLVLAIVLVWVLKREPSSTTPAEASPPTNMRMILSTEKPSCGSRTRMPLSSISTLRT